MDRTGPLQLWMEKADTFFTSAIHFEGKTSHHSIGLRVWVGDGPASINSASNFFGNNFSIGSEIGWGEQKQFILGLEFIAKLFSLLRGGVNPFNGFFNVLTGTNPKIPSANVTSLQLLFTADRFKWIHALAGDRQE